MLLHVYFAGKFLKKFLITLSIFIIFMFLIDLIEQLRKFAESVDFPQVFFLAVLNLPGSVYQIVPLIIVISSAWIFLSLARNSELIVFRAAGKSSLSMLIMPAILSILIGVLTIGFFNPIVASTSKRYADVKAKIVDGQETTISIGYEGLWLRQADKMGHTVIRAQRANADATMLYDVTLIKLNEEKLPVQRIEAKTLTLMDTKWIANNSTIWPIEFGVTAQSNAKEFKIVEIPTSLKREQIIDQFGDPSTISVWSLLEFIEQLERAGFSAKRYSVWLQSELAKPIFFLAMMLIAAAFCMRQNRVRGTSLNVLMAVLVGFLLFYSKNFVLILGTNGQLPVFYAAWGPSFAALFISLGLFLNREEG
jgi:lipopolysaccharide export system permease protein